MGPEKQLENKIKKWLKEKNIYHVKIHGSAFQKAGVPDILACINGKFVGIEVKSAIGRTSKLQDHNIQQIEYSCGIAYVVNPQNWEEVKEELNEIYGGKLC